MQQYNIGEKVVYPSHGVGQITGFEKIEVAGETHECIVMLYERGMKLRVPKSKAETSGLRGMSSKETVKKAFKIFKDQPRVQGGLWARRSRSIEDKIRTGDLVQVSQVLRDLTPRNLSERGLSYSEREFYEDAMTRVTMEVSEIMQKPVDVVRKEVEKALSEQPRTAIIEH